MNGRTGYAALSGVLRALSGLNKERPHVFGFGRRGPVTLGEKNKEKNT